METAKMRSHDCGVAGGQGRDAADMTWGARVVGIALAAALVWTVLAWFLN